MERLAGLETEYAICFQANSPELPSPSKYQLYRALVTRLRRTVLTVTAKHFKDGLFSANGGAVWFESERPSSGAGLVEGSTPECRGARQLVVYQRAQDRLLSQAAKQAFGGDEMRLIKNDRDARGNVYGAQENYEVTIATGWRLFLWRAGLISLLPLMLLTWIGLAGLVVATLIYYACAGIICFLIPSRWRTSAQLTKQLLGNDWCVGDATGSPSPRWLESLLLLGARVVTMPLAAALYLLIAATAFHEVRKMLLPFLISRPVLSGAGMVTDDGQFRLADKADAINCVIGFGGMVGDRPLFNFGHFFKAICVEVPFAPAEFFDLLAPRQRLQIGLGDSNMAEIAEYLRTGTTILMLDMIEGGELPDFPTLAKPIRSLRAFCADATLKQTRPWGESEKTAVQIQRAYWQACHDFLHRHRASPTEAWEVLTRWGRCLFALETQPEVLVGSLDWVTKKYLLDELKDLSPAAKKKLDIRYHELSPDGYFEKLKATGLVKEVATDDEIERAIRTAPNDTPATTRGHYIREFAHGFEPVYANWKTVAIGSGRHAKTIRLADYGQPRRQQPT